MDLNNEELINKIKKYHGLATFNDLMLNKDNAVLIINYLKNMGIKDINELLIYEIDIFLDTFDNFKNKIMKYSLESFVKDVNDDFMNIEDYLN